MKPIYKPIYARLTLGLGMTMLLLSACSKMNDLHDGYLQKGEKIYVGKPDSVKVFGGRERVLIRLWDSDPKAVNLVVYWLSRTDSQLVTIPAHGPRDSIDIIIPGLPEYSYSFELVTANKDMQNRSVPFEVSGSSYGQNFQSSLLDRLISTSSLNDEHQLAITWLGGIQKGIGTELSYYNTAGDSMTVFVPMAEPTTLIEDVSSPVQYRTLFLPEETAIDTFYTAFRPVNL